MARRPLALAILLAIAPDLGGAATHGVAPEGGRATASRPARARQRGAQRPARRARPASLAEAKAAMTSLMRDRVRRRFRHQWERAIGELLRAARGRDAAAALLEAARARYALYRWSANEADREAALKLAARATRAGSREAPALARAIRREAGEERPAPPSRRHGPPRPEPNEEESPPDPALEAAVAELAPNAPPALPLGRSGGEGRARVSEVRTWASEEYTRVAVYLSHWVGWHKLELPSAPGTPRRLAIDFRPAVLEGAALARPVAGEQVGRVRAAQNAPDTVRVVLELPGRDGIQVFALEDPPRLVLDVGTREARADAVAATGPPPASTASAANADAAAPAHPERGAPAPAERTAVEDPAEPKGAGGAEPKGISIASEAPAADDGATEPSPSPPDDAAEEAAGPIRRIVVDAGHGGHDPGAIGPRRVREKDVTLAISRRLARKLRQEGFEVVLTRQDDRFLALEERTAVANAARGDLFVSIHANAHPRRNRAGVETYFLNTADDRYAARLAARENGLDLGEGEPEVARILTDLGAKASAGASRRLARLVQREVTSGVRAKVGEVRDLGVKGALFYVLLGARMPAVLVEAAFISNRDEERRLASGRYQDEVAAGIARAVAVFARSGERVVAAR